jgi:hypothetical protein
MKGLLLAAAAAIFSYPAVGQAQDLALSRFATAKQEQVREFARGASLQVPSTVWSFFDAVRVDDWQTATNLAAKLDYLSGRFTNSAGAQVTASLQTLIWSPISETIGAYDQFHNWDNRWLHRFGREIIESIPQGSIYFGGTDPGRFVISALSESHREGKPFFTITQNQLADSTYLEYLRKIYGAKIQLPTDNEMRSTMDSYITDAQERLQSGKLRPGEEVRVVDGRSQVSGIVSVMAINGMLAKLILEKNPRKECFVEESYAIDWMYPYLVPHGLIFELRDKPLSMLPTDSINKDRAYWKRMTSEMVGDWITDKTTVKGLCEFAEKTYQSKNLSGFKGDTAYAKNGEAQKSFGKLRSSIAGLYVWRADHANDLDERRQFESDAEMALKQSFALCPYSPEVVMRYTRLLVDLKRSEDAFQISKTASRIDPENDYLKEVLHSLAASR